MESQVDRIWVENAASIKIRKRQRENVVAQELTARGPSRSVSQSHESWFCYFFDAVRKNNNASASVINHKAVISNMKIPA